MEAESNFWSDNRVLSAFLLLFLSFTKRSAAMQGIVQQTDYFIHVLPPEVHRTPFPLEISNSPERYSAWLAILSVSICVIVVICFCYLCWRYYPQVRFNSQSCSRRQSSIAALVPPLSTIVSFHASANHTDTGVGGTYHYEETGVVNFAFDSHLNVSRERNRPVLDRPPSYTAVVSQNQTTPTSTTQFGNQFLNAPINKIVETPPPAYVTVSPFQSDRSAT